MSKSVILTLGGKQVLTRRPSLLARNLALGPWRDSLGWDPDQERIDPAQAQPGMHLAWCIGAVALCWDGEALDLPRWRDCGMDIIELGERASDVLLQRYRAPELVDAGRALLEGYFAPELVTPELPRKAEVEEVADFS